MGSVIAQSDTYFVAKDDIILVDYIFDIGTYFEENGTFIAEPGSDHGHQQVGKDFQVTVGRHAVVAPFENTLFGMKINETREVKAKAEEIPSYVDQFGGKDYYWQITLTMVIYDESTDIRHTSQPTTVINSTIAASSTRIRTFSSPFAPIYVVLLSLGVLVVLYRIKI